MSYDEYSDVSLLDVGHAMEKVTLVQGSFAAGKMTFGRHC